MYFTPLSSQLSAISLKINLMVQVAGFDLKIHSLQWYSPRARHSMAAQSADVFPLTTAFQMNRKTQDTAHHQLTMIPYLSSSSQSSNGNLKGCRNLLLLFHAPNHVCSKSGDFMHAYRTLKFQTQQLVLALGMSPVAALSHGFYKLGI